MSMKMKLFAIGVVMSSVLAPRVFASDYETAFVTAEAGDFARAAEIWDGLAQHGSADAQFNLALMYHAGVSGNLNESEAVRLYHAAAERGHPKAQEFLAVAYQEGWFGLSRDVKKAEFWRKQLERSL